jgi:hypothetical protein
MVTVTSALFQGFAYDGVGGGVGVGVGIGVGSGVGSTVATGVCVCVAVDSVLGGSVAAGSSVTRNPPQPAKSTRVDRARAFQNITGT